MDGARERRRLDDAADTEGASVPIPFDARAFLKAFEAEGGRVYSDGRSFAIVYPAEAEAIPMCLVEWGAVVGAAQERVIYGMPPEGIHATSPLGNEPSRKTPPSGRGGGIPSPEEDEGSRQIS